MQRFLLTVLLLLSAATPWPSFADQDAAVAKFNGTELEEAELAYIISRSSASVRADLKRSAADRTAFIGALIMSKRLAVEVDAMTLNANGDDYWAKELALLGAKREFAQKLFQQKLALPDLEPLARERYDISKAEIASVPESRSVSHILLLCREDCDAETTRAELADIRARIINGEDFATLAKEITEDAASRDNGGRLKTQIVQENTRLDEAFRTATFALAEVGDISEVFQSRVGFHIVRLEAIEPARIRSYDEVKDQLIPEIERRYRADALNLYLDQFQPKDDLELDYSKINAILGLDPETSWAAE